MKIEMTVLEYTPEHGLQLEWGGGFTIATQLVDSVVVISANTAGLVSLARHLLTLAQGQVPSGTHIHFDDSNSLEAGSCELIIEKIED